MCAQVFRIKYCQAIHAAEKKFARCRFVGGIGVEFIVLQTVGFEVVLKQSRFRPKAGQPAVGRNPEVVRLFVVGQNAVHHVVGQSVFGCIMDKLIFGKIQPAQAMAVGADPKYVGIIGVNQQGFDGIGRQAVPVVFFGLKYRKNQLSVFILFCFIQAIVRCANPPVSIWRAFGSRNIMIGRPGVVKKRKLPSGYIEADRFIPRKHPDFSGWGEAQYRKPHDEFLRHRDGFHKPSFRV